VLKLPVKKDNNTKTPDVKKHNKEESHSVKKTSNSGSKPAAGKKHHLHEHDEEMTEHDGEPLYCICKRRLPQTVELVGCDGENCKIQWFHLPCVGLLKAVSLM
jgi:hypothetical protein